MNQPERVDLPKDSPSLAEEVISEMRDTLTLDEWVVIGASFGLFGGIKYSMREISRQLDITVVDAERIKAEGFTRLLIYGPAFRRYMEETFSSLEADFDHENRRLI